MVHLSTTKTLVRIVPLFALLIAGIWLLTRPGELAPESVAGLEARADLAGLQGAERDQVLNNQGEAFSEEANIADYEWADYWITRYTYPTFEFDQRWLLEAREQDKLIPSALPAGEVVASKGEAGLNLDPTQFTFLGPEPLESDGCLNCFNYGHVAGRTNWIASDPVSPTIAYAGSDGGGVWKTTNCCDENTTWEPITDDPLINGISIGHIILDPNDHNTVYAGTGDLRYGSFSFGAAGVLKSTDGGATWEVLGADVFGPYRPQDPGEFPQYQAIGKVAVDPNNSNNVVVGTKTGLFVSNDAGQNWEGPCYTNDYLDQRQDMTGLIATDMGATTRLVAAVGTRGFPTPVQGDLGLTGANGVYRTTLPAAGCPATDDWELINDGWPAGTGDGDPVNDLVGRIDIDVAPSDPNYIYAQVANNTNSGATLGVWRTTDGGDTWVQWTTPSDFGVCSTGIGQTWYNAGLTIDPNNPEVVFLSQIDLYRSIIDQPGKFFNLTFGYCGSEDVHVDHHARAFVGGDSDVLLVGSDGGIYVTHNATAADPVDIAFTQLNDTVGSIEFYSGDITGNFAFDDQPGINAGAQDNGSSVYVWMDGQPAPAMWQLRKGGDGMYARIEPVEGLRWYQESQNGNLAVSLTGPYGPQVGASGAWAADRKSFVFPYELDKYNCGGGICTHMIAGSYRVWETIEGAVPNTSWNVNSPDLTKNTLADRSIINQLSYGVSDNSIAIVGTNDGNVQYGFDLGQGIANSATWVDVTGGNTVLPNRPILDVATDPIDPLIGYAAVGGFDQNTPDQPGHVFQVTCTADCASFSWADKSGDLPNIPVDSIIANPNFPQQVFAGTDWGLYFTNDINEASPQWYRFDAGLPRVMIWDMAIDRGFTTLAVFTRGRGAYVWPLPSEAIQVAAVELGPDSVVEAPTGSVAAHTFTITNNGITADWFDLTISGNDWTTTVESPVLVGSGASVEVTVNVQVPFNAAGTSDSFVLTATSQADPTVSATANGTTNAVQGTFAIYVPVAIQP